MKHFYFALQKSEETELVDNFGTYKDILCELPENNINTSIIYYENGTNWDLEDSSNIIFIYNVESIAIISVIQKCLEKNRNSKIFIVGRMAICYSEKLVKMFKNVIILPYERNVAQYIMQYGIDVNQNVKNDNFSDNVFINKTPSSLENKTIPWKPTVMPLRTSYGCNGSCIFCYENILKRTQPDLYQRVEFDSKYVFNSILEYYMHGIYLFYFIDNCFYIKTNDSMERVKQICAMIIDNNIEISFYIELRADDLDYDIIRILKKAGLRNIFIGIENINNNVLARYKKGIDRNTIENAIVILNKVKMPFTIGYIMFDPYSTIDEILNSYQFIIANGIDKHQRFDTIYNYLEIFDQSKLCKECFDNTILLDHESLNRNSHFKKKYKLIDNDADKFTDCCEYIFMCFNIIKEDLRSNIHQEGHTDIVSNYELNFYKEITINTYNLAWMIKNKCSESELKIYCNRIINNNLESDYRDHDIMRI